MEVSVFHHLVILIQHSLCVLLQQKLLTVINTQIRKPIVKVPHPDDPMKQSMDTKRIEILNLQLLAHLIADLLIALSPFSDVG